jgi:predicted Zn finger-like uncharacterized protein
MDVQCERCKTEYEFDDALVSGRGTTVKCTNCGFQFKVRPAVGGGSSERWTVRIADGTELVFTTLRELQRAITQRQVGRNDTLSRGNGPPRPLGHIAELEPFFRNSDRPVPLPGASAVSRDGVGTNAGFPGSRQVSAPNISPYAQTTAIPSQSSPRASQPSQPDGTPRPRSNTLRPPSAVGAPPPPPQPAHLAPIPSAPPRQPSDGGATNPYAPQALPRGAPYAQPGPPLPDRTQRTVPLGPYAAAPRDIPTVTAPMPPTRPMRYGDPSYEDIDTSEPIPADPRFSIAPQRRRMGGWIVAVVLMLGVGVIGYKVGEPYLSTATKGSAPGAALDPKAAKFLSDGEHAIEDGNLDLAKENFDKASVLQEKDPHVLLDLARLAAIRADIPWLKLRLLPPESTEDVAAAKQQLADLLPGLRRAADDATAASPDEAGAMRVKVDALRIAGEVSSARNLVAKMGTASQTASQPEAAYVLAALDLGELAPLWATVIDRLRLAAAAEGNLGRARAALVYAEVKSGDVAGAQNDLSRLSPRSPLASALRAFVQKGPAAHVDGGAAAVASASPAPVDVNSLPHSGGSSAGSGSGSSDPRVILEQAAEAENRGQLPRASKLYEDALRYAPTSSEALAGLGSVSLKQGDSATARQYFGRALASNPNYMPALVGQADALWKEGDRKAAVAKYKDIVERFPESAGYPAYCKTRAAGSASGVAAPEATAPTPAPGGKPGELSLPANTPSDLPGNPP